MTRLYNADGTWQDNTTGGETVSEQRPLQQPRQTDAEAANSANPDTDRLPAWDDPDWDSYLYDVDRQYRFDWLVAHGQITTNAEAREYWDQYDDEDEDE